MGIECYQRKGPEYCVRLSAQGYAAKAGITLTRDQLNIYVTERVKMPTGNEEPFDPKPWLLFDHELLDKVLTPQQSRVFRSCFPGSFDEDSPQDSYRLYHVHKYVPPRITPPVAA